MLLQQGEGEEGGKFERRSCAPNLALVDFSSRVRAVKSCQITPKLIFSTTFKLDGCAEKSAPFGELPRHPLGHVQE